MENIILVELAFRAWELMNGTLDAVSMPAVYLMAIRKADKAK